MSWFGTVCIEMTPGADGGDWHTVAPLAYFSREDGPGAGVIIEIQPGMVTDGASIPRLFWRLIGCPLRDRYAPAAIIHDGLYAAQKLPRKAADELFREMLIDLGVGYVKAWAMYQAVRLGGGAIWGGHTKESVSAARNLAIVKELV